MSLETAGNVRYIKLGPKGSWEADCFSEGIIRLGFNTGQLFDICRSANWTQLAQAYAKDGRPQSKITENVNQVRLFFEDQGDTIWITFSNRLMWWAKVDPCAAPMPHPDSGTFRPTAYGWSSKDTKGNDLHMDGLSGAVTQLTGFRGTSCDVREAAYVLRRIKGERPSVVDEAEQLELQLGEKIVAMMRLLTPKDFELLVDLVFSQSGWRRLASVGDTQKTVDMELELPSTGERAFVQVKSRTTQKEFEDEYLKPFSDMRQFTRMFYIFHTGEVASNDVTTTIVGPARLAQMVMDAGLTKWLMRKVS